MYTWNTKECCSAIQKKNEILSFPTIWRHLDVKKSDKDKYSLLSYIQNLKNECDRDRFTNTESKLVLTSEGRGVGSGKIGIGD